MITVHPGWIIFILVVLLVAAAIIVCRGEDIKSQARQVEDLKTQNALLQMRYRDLERDYFRLASEPSNPPLRGLVALPARTRFPAGRPAPQEGTAGGQS